MIYLVVLFTFAATFATTPDWNSAVPIPPGGRPNPYDLPADELIATVRAGRLHALHYPVATTGIVLPYSPIKRFLHAEASDPLRALLQSVASLFTSFHNYDDVENWLGLQTYPPSEGADVYFVPFKNGVKPLHRMGFTVREGNPKGFTISCAECHTGNLFGRRVMGMSNRFPRANRFFHEGLNAASYVGPGFFQWATEATDAETEMFRRFRKNGELIGTKLPVQLGLDTSLAQVALSLARRSRDAFATPVWPVTVRSEPLATHVADSKPAVWWNVKYKNRWLSDGSVISGNPIFTNFIWNEIGRGANLQDLEQWLAANETVVRELTTAVFNTEAPPFTDFFPAPNRDQVREGEVLFNQYCARCHGQYAHEGSRLVVRYFPQTPVIDVGTDPGRYSGMKSLEQLNELSISKRNNIHVQATRGYVPPPLVGIWARWPYFHNNSAPNLCAVLTAGAARPKTYWARPAEDKSKDFDVNCNGYPRRRPPEGTSEEFLYQSGSEGLSNLGHDEGIFLKDGRELLTNAQKFAIIRFLQTL